ncbi:MAG: glycoside hydrolase family 1 protein [Ignavibacteriales bacterium]|nr:glycoside hydrolase family 1 protein [Ignavibacteriales bacterium]
MNKFYWGTATSAFQIEGSIENDFTDWEKQGKFKFNGAYPNYDNGSNHWNSWKEDFDLIKKLNLNSYRFSIEWARIEPEQGNFSSSALRQYSEMIDYLNKLEIEPFITLSHFTHPKWFHELTPWHEKESISSFTTYAKLLIDLFADKINFWISFNEPIVWALAAYGDAKFPPGKKDLNLMMKAIHNMMEAHTIIYDYLKKRNPNSKLGIAKHFIIFKESRSWFFLDKKVTDHVDQFFNKMLLNAFQENRLSHWFPTVLKYDSPIKLDNKIDFWGINYYYKIYSQFRFSLKNPIFLFPKEPQTDMGWEIYPKGLKKIIKLVAKTNKDIFITENGIATTDEELRKSFIKRHLKILNQQKDKYNVKGYFYWSLMDNYEWLEGKSKRFGLINVDYENNFKRSLKSSSSFYIKQIKKYSKSKSLQKQLKTTTGK